jgi:DNA-binding MarR family transcriptional regulator
MTSSNLMLRQNHKGRKLRRRIPSSAASAASDSIETLLTEWRRERPDLDAWPIAVFARLWRLSEILVREADTWLAPLGLTFESFSVLVTLRRSGPPYELNPTALYRESLLSSGAITNRIDRVEDAGLVRRLPDPNDRRGTNVRLTPKGFTLADRAIARHFANMGHLLASLELAEREQLTALLAKLLSSVEQPHQRKENPSRRVLEKRSYIRGNSKKRPAPAADN